MDKFANQASGFATNPAPPVESRGAQIGSRLEKLSAALRDLRNMTFATSERIVGSEPTAVGSIQAGQNVPTAVPCFMAQTENMIGDIERTVSEIRDELGRIIRAF